MSTLGAVIDAVKANLEIVDTEKDAIISGFVRTALRQLQKKRYWFLLKRTNLTLVSGGSSVTLPSDYSTIKTIHLIKNNNIYTQNNGFDIVNYDDFYADYLTTSEVPTGYPCACTILDNNSEKAILFDKSPSSNLIVPITYYAQDTTLPTSSSDISIWFDEGFDLVRALTQLLYQRYSQNDTAAATDEVTFYTQALNQQNDFNLPVL